MNESIFNINLLSNTLEKNNIIPSQSNCYLFLFFFLERSQLVSNIIRTINPDIKNSLSFGIKYCLINESNYDKIIRRVKEYKNDFDKNELISELIKFIRNTIDEKKIELIKNDNSPNKITELFNSFENIKIILKNLDNHGIDDNDLYDFIQSNYDLKNESIRIKLDEELKLLDILWEKTSKKSELYLLLKNWL